MKILFVNNFSSHYGGAEKVMHAQARLLIKNSHSVEFFTKTSKPCGFKNPFKIFYNPETEAQIARVLAESRPDIVHCHNIYYHLTPSVICACKQVRVPVVMTLHDPRLLCPGGTMPDKNWIHSIAALLEFYFSRWARLYDYVSVFICPSQAMANLAVKSGIKPDRLAVVHNFLDDAFFESPPVYSDKGYFLYIGRLSREKGVHYLLEAAKFLPENIEFHIAGTGPEEDNLKQDASPNVKFRGYLEGSSLQEEYSGCIATVLPCNWFETFGLTIAESFAYGKPVIASRIGAIPELITENTDGFLFKPGNSGVLSNYIYKMHKDRRLSDVMGKNAREKAERLFNSGLHYKNLIKVYNSVA